LDFEKYGVERHAIAPAIREVEALGFIRITQMGRSGNGEWRRPNKFALTHLPAKDNPKAPEDWKRIKTIEEAELIAKAARNASPKKQKASVGKTTSTRRGKPTSNADSPVRESPPLSRGETPPLSISRVDTPSSGLPSTLLGWCVDIPNINPSDEADAAAWLDAWLGQIPTPTPSLSEIRSALGYRQ
jgi:hypothetical protein